jgi:hypothetical protein
LRACKERASAHLENGAGSLVALFLGLHQLEQILSQLLDLDPVIVLALVLQLVGDVFDLVLAMRK